MCYNYPWNPQWAGKLFFLLSCFLLSRYIVIKRPLHHFPIAIIRSYRSKDSCQSFTAHYPILISPAGQEDLPGIPGQKVNSLAPYKVSLVIRGGLCKSSLSYEHSIDCDRAIRFWAGRNIMPSVRAGLSHSHTVQSRGGAQKAIKPNFFLRAGGFKPL